jgi:hypothetical protein
MRIQNLTSVIAVAAIFFAGAANASTDIYLGNLVGYNYDVNIAGVSFFGNAGLASGMFFTTPTPDGQDAIHLQSHGGNPAFEGSATIDLSAFTSGQQTVTFYDTYRPGYAIDTVDVFYGATLLGSVKPSSLGWTEESFNFTADGSNLTFQSEGIAGDANASISAISISDTGSHGGGVAPVASTPELSTSLMMIFGALGLMAWRRKDNAIFGA